MNRFLLLGLCVLLVGCSSGDSLETYITEPGHFLRDPHFEKYQEEQDALERRYVNKEINFAEYTEKKKELDDKYTGEVRDREHILSDGR